MRLFAGIVLTLALALLPLSVQNASAANTNNFRITSFDIQYDLSKDAGGRSVLKTVETITADFPNANQNHGLERAIPSKYNGHTVDLNVTAVTDADGEKQQYSLKNSGDMSTLRIGDPDSYVQGKQTYKIYYTQNDVTRFYSDNNRDEWYWDTNGTQWKVPIDVLTVTAKIDETLVSDRAGEPACYQGASSSTNRCFLIGNDKTSATVTAYNLKAGENVTVAFGFNKDTFAAYQQSLSDKLFNIWVIVFFVTSFIGLVLLIALSFAYSRRNNRLKELAITPVEYIPPKGTSVTVSSQVLTYATGIFSAQLIDFAVRHFIEIIETRPKSTWKAAEYDIKIITDPSKLLAEEQEILSDMFG